MGILKLKEYLTHPFNKIITTVLAEQFFKTRRSRYKKLQHCCFFILFLLYEV